MSIGIVPEGAVWEAELKEKHRMVRLTVQHREISKCSATAFLRVNGDKFKSAFQMHETKAFQFQDDN